MENIKDPILQIKDVCISYTSDVMAVKHVSADIEKNSITAIMGPSGCGKSTLLRAVNRMHELYKNIRVTGEILLNGENVLQMPPMEERRRIGMVFQRPNPFPTMKCGTVGRGERLTDQTWNIPFRRSAAAFVHRPLTGTPA